MEGASRDLYRMDMDLREKLIEKTLKWVASLKSPMVHTRLADILHSQVLYLVFQCSPLPSDSPQVIEFVENATLEPLIAANFSRIKQEIEQACTQELGNFTSKAALASVKKTYPSDCFQHLSTLSSLISGHFTHISSKYLSSDSLSLLSPTDFHRRFEQQLLSAYESLKIEDFSLLEVCFESSFQLPEACSLSHLLPFQLDMHLSSLYTAALQSLQCLQELAQGLLPKWLYVRYESRVKDRFTAFAQSLSTASYPRYQATMGEICTMLREGRDGLVLFDDRLTDCSLREIVLTAFHLALGTRDIEAKVAVLQRIAVILRLDVSQVLQFNMFTTVIEDIRAKLTYDQICFIGFCALFVIVSQEDVTYTPVDRILYRDFLAILFGNHTHNAFLSAIYWTVGKTAEMALAHTLKTHPLVAHIPALVLEEALSSSSAGRIVPSTPQGGLKGLFQTVVSQVSRALTEVQGEGEKQQNCTWELLCKEVSLNVTVAVSGWQSEQSDYGLDWKQLVQYPLQGTLLGYHWEAGTAVRFASLTAVSALSGLVVGPWSALWSGMSGSLQVFKAADRRAKQAGRILAQCIRMKACGFGPVTLVAFSLGASVVYHCLKDLLKGPEQPILDVILLGGAAPNTAEQWKKIRPVVKGRLINVYSNQDWTLRLYTTTSGAKAIGLGPLDIEGIENVDATGLVEGHQDHRKRMKELLDMLNYQP